MRFSVVLMGSQWTIVDDKKVYSYPIPSPPDGWEYTGDFDNPVGQYALPYIAAPVGWGKISQYYKNLPAKRHPVFGIHRPFLTKAHIRRPYILDPVLVDMWNAFSQGMECSDVLKRYKSTIEVR